MLDYLVKRGYISIDLIFYKFFSMFDLKGFVYSIIVLIIVIGLHEFSHAWVANFFGDPTAKREGRVSLNPFRHIDVIGMLMLFIVGLGWGKPVPVNSYYFKKPKLYEALTAFAGPLMNLIIALIAVIPLKYFSNFRGVIWGDFLTICSLFFEISLGLFAFNMLPFAPLDGSKFLQLIVPKKYENLYAYYLAKSGMYFMVFVIFDNLFLSKYLGFSILSLVLGKIIVFLKVLIYLGA